MDASRQVVRLLQLYADFDGRSTRSDVLYLFLMFFVVMMPFGIVAIFLGPGRGEWLLLTVELLVLCPSFAVSVRRYHDVGWSGWWALLLAPWWTIEVRRDVQILYPALISPASRLPTYVDATALFLASVAFVMLFWKPEQGTNRYGPNPRHGPVGEPA